MRSDLSTLKCGDEVIVWNHKYCGCEPVVAKITKATPMYIYVDLQTSGERRFSRKTGQMWGGYRHGHISVATAEERKDAAEVVVARAQFRNRSMRRLGEIGHGELSDDELTRIVAVLDEHDAKKGKE